MFKFRQIKADAKEGGGAMLDILCPSGANIHDLSLLLCVLVEKPNRLCQSGTFLCPGL